MSDSDSNGGGFLGCGALVLFTVVPLGIGIALLYLRYTTVHGIEEAKDWPAVPCVVEKAEMVQGDEESYLDFVYRYQVDGKTYHSDRLDLMPGSMGDDGPWERSILKANPVGSEAVCFVDPDDPNFAVFDREHGGSGARNLRLLAFPFLCVGIGFMLALLRGVAEALVGKEQAHQQAMPARLDPGPPPRRLGIWRSVDVLVGGGSNKLVPWLFMVGFTFVFVLLGGDRMVAGWLRSSAGEQKTKGTITRIDDSDQQEFGMTVYEVEITFNVDGTSHTASCFSRDSSYDVGDEVDVVYHPDRPREAYIPGTRSNWAPSWVIWIPFGVVVLLAIGLFFMYLHNIRNFFLLKYGEMAIAEKQQPGDARLADSDGDFPLQPACCFVADGETVQGHWDYGSKRPRRLQHATVLYRRSRPRRNVVLESLPRRQYPVGRPLGFLQVAPDIAVVPLALLAIVVLLFWM